MASRPPSSDDYPALREWLATRVFALGGQCVSQDYGPRRRYAIEQYHVRGTLLLFIVLADANGWDAFVPASRSNSTLETLAALDAAIGHVEPRHDPG